VDWITSGLAIYLWRGARFPPRRVETQGSAHSTLPSVTPQLDGEPAHRCMLSSRMISICYSASGHSTIRLFETVAGLVFGLWGCYPAKLLFGLLQVSAEALDEKIMLCSHIDLIAHNSLMSWNECSIQGVTRGTESLRLEASEILFVSSNSWDASGAKAYGYRVCWCNTQDQEAEFLEGTPDLTVTQLDQIANLSLSKECATRIGGGSAEFARS